MFLEGVVVLPVWTTFKSTGSIYFPLTSVLSQDSSSCFSFTSIYGKKMKSCGILVTTYSSLACFGPLSSANNGKFSKGKFNAKALRHSVVHFMNALSWPDQNQNTRTMETVADVDCLGLVASANVAAS